jgi:hypothetical protein
MRHGKLAVSTACQSSKTVETAFDGKRGFTGLKPGVNERIAHFAKQGGRALS